MCDRLEKPLPLSESQNIPHQHKGKGSTVKEKKFLTLQLSKSCVNSFSPQFAESHSNIMFSPVTDLALNLHELTTASLCGTPKRRLSLSSTGTPTPPPVRPLFRQLSSVDGGCFVDSPSPLDSPTYEQRFESVFESLERDQNLRSSREGSAFKRYSSVPTNLSELQGSCSPSFENLGFPKGSITRTVKSPNSDLASSFGGGVDDQDGGSQDSGVGQEPDDFKFIKPIDLAPRSRYRHISEETCSPKKYSPVKQSPGKTIQQNSFGQDSSPAKCRRPTSAPAGTITFNLKVPSPIQEADSPGLLTSSLTSSMHEDDEDDGFLEQLDIDREQTSLPSSMSGLLTAPITVANDEKEKENITVNNRIWRTCTRPRGLFRSPSAPKLGRSQSFDVRSRPFSYKRSEPPRENTTPVSNKRRKSVVEYDTCSNPETEIAPARRMHRCHSETEAMIKSALNKGDSEQDLIGDFSKDYCLPLIRGKHQDLKAITPNTLEKLINGEYDQVVEEYTIIDCRYPYEYEGGHIKNAKNIYTKEGIMKEFLETPPKEKNSSKRTVLIFHCEFSSERAPNLSRFLRNKDRDSNKDCYPALHYPEIYLLEGGYKALYCENKDLCEPPEYKPMLHVDHAQDLKHFRTKSKSWAAGDRNSRLGLRTGSLFKDCN
ncbi:M-phase inducer phosphatase [Lingula anatina]|uniref:M-phase inducer phosphatase n=1 Tax=Lingula anatina TaxID=7574 RepID=A0A1S3HDL9_LINAN|nr:M-phase inducer phosphatase [Lingula anatina]|eukprot:XP_013383189.1 M-phase inducer phosphatase [Lingula anatina]